MPEPRKCNAIDAATLLKLGFTLVEAGEARRAIDLVQQVLQAHPGDSALRDAAALILTCNVPKFHLGMLRDEARNAAYAKAIEKAGPGAKRVLDIGTGSGLLAMMAARAGATTVVGCEANPLLAATATEIVERNGLGDRVRVVPRHSTQLEAKRDLGGKADLIVTETFGHDLIGEGALASVGDAVARLARPGVQVIPARAMIMVALGNFDAPGFVEHVCGFDIGRINRHALGFFRQPVDSPGLELRSEPQPLFSFDLASSSHPDTADAMIESLGGEIAGLVQWIRLELDEDNIYENRPGAGAASHWEAVCWPFDKPADTRAGDRIRVRGLRNGSRLRVSAEAQS